MSDTTLRVDKIKDGKAYFVQTSNGTIRLVGSLRSPFLKDLKLVKNAVFKIPKLSLQRATKNPISKPKKKKVSKKKSRTTKKRK